MPRAKKKAEPTVEPAQTNSLPVMFDKILVVEHSSTSEHGPLTVEDAKTHLKWETEDVHIKRMHEQEPNTPNIKWEYGEDFHCVDSYKKKVACWNNAGNRPFDMSWCEHLIHTILTGQWAGPLTISGETVNGETVRISRYGRILSGQHQETGLILADERLQIAREWMKKKEGKPPYPVVQMEKWIAVWKGHDHCVIETIVIFGVSEDERVLRTIDYVKPRSAADMLYTMSLYKSNSPVERKEMTRMLAAAINLLWTRTNTQGYKTHPEIVGFLERHKTLLKCVEHLFVTNRAVGVGQNTRLGWESEEDYQTRMAQDISEDGGRLISKLHISAGQASALMYLMACSDDETTEYAENYRQEEPAPSEKNLKWDYWEVAREFWTLLATDESFEDVRDALVFLMASTPLNDKNEGLGGRLSEKLAIIAQAWDRFKDQDEEKWHWNDGYYAPFSEDDRVGPDGCLSLAYSRKDERGDDLPEGRRRLINVAYFGGVDCPSTGKADPSGVTPDLPTTPPEPEEDDPTEEEIEKMREKIQREHLEEEERKEAKRAAKRDE